MNEVYLDKKGSLFLNGQKIDDVTSVSVKTTWLGSSVVLEFNASYKSDFQSNIKTHSLEESAKQ